LQGYADVGVTDTGLITKRKMNCCTATAAYIPWKAIVALRMTRACCSGTIAVTAKTEEDVHGATTKGFGTDTSQTTIYIRTHRSLSEGLYQPLTTIMSDNFSHMEELPGMHMQNTNGHIKVTKAGMFLDSDISCCCGGFVKTFMPWGSMVVMRYRHRSCFKNAACLIEDRFQKPLDVGIVPYKDFEEVRKVFSKTVSEVSAPSSSESGAPVPRGLTLNQEGMHYTRKYCGLQQLFILWSKIDGLKINMGTCGCAGALHLITEAGHDFTVLKSGKRDLLWE